MRPRFKRGDSCEKFPGLLFFRYNRGKEMWVTPDRFEIERENKKRIQAKRRKTPKYKSKMREYFRTYYHRPYQKAKQAAYYRRPEVRTRYNKKYAADPVLRARMSAYSKTDKAIETRRLGRQRRKEKIKSWQKKYHALKMATDAAYKLRHTYRRRIQIAFRSQGIRKNSRTAKMLGCSFEFFRGWIENQFSEGMHWKNYGNKPGQWEIHHVAPIAAFRLEIPDERDRAFHYSNCKPLWSEANRALSDKIEVDGKQIQARKLRGNIIPFKQSAA